MILLIIEFCTVYYLFLYVQIVFNECTVRYSIQTLYCQTVGRVHSISPVHSLLGISVHLFIHPFFHPSILNQMSGKGSLEHWASWWAGCCCSCLLFQTWICAHCSLARCAGSSLLVSATHPFIGIKGGNTGLVLLIPHYNVQILGAKLIRMCLCITPITHRKEITCSLRGASDLTDVFFLCFQLHALPKSAIQ